LLSLTRYAKTIESFSIEFLITKTMEPHIKELNELGACKEAIEFASEFKTLQAAWDACTNSSWMIWYMAHSGHYTHKDIVQVANECARMVLKFVPAWEDRTRSQSEKWEVGHEL
jgi:hypothetical protein